MLYSQRQVKSVSGDVGDAGDMGDCCDEEKSASWGLRFLLLILLLSIYLVLGALIFSALERPQEEVARKRLVRMHQHIQDNGCSNETEMTTFMDLAVKAYRRGTSLSNMHNKTYSDWDFSQSLFFAATVITTVGYGHVAPATAAGRAFCVMFAIVGIPLLLILLQTLVSRLLLVSRQLHSKLSKRLMPRVTGSTLRLLHYAIVASGIVVVMFFIPAMVFTLLEHRWDYGNSLYFVFISMSTIGLGDYVPGGDTHVTWKRELYHVCLVGYLVMGLGLMMTLVAVTGDVPELQPGRCTCPCQRRRKDSDGEDQPVLVASLNRSYTADADSSIDSAIARDSTVQSFAHD